MFVCCYRIYESATKVKYGIITFGQNCKRFSYGCSVDIVTLSEYTLIICVLFISSNLLNRSNARMQ